MHACRQIDEECQWVSEMNVWERHALRQRRQDEFQRLDDWLAQHPIAAWFVAIGIGLGILEVSELLKFLFRLGKLAP
jgi:hypothetical protein